MCFLCSSGWYYIFMLQCRIINCMNRIQLVCFEQVTDMLSGFFRHHLTRWAIRKCSSHIPPSTYMFSFHVRARGQSQPGVMTLEQVKSQYFSKVGHVFSITFCFPFKFKRRMSKVASFNFVVSDYRIYRKCNRELFHQLKKYTKKYGVTVKHMKHYLTSIYKERTPETDAKVTVVCENTLRL